MQTLDYFQNSNNAILLTLPPEQIIFLAQNHRHPEFIDN
jgi:hypothetical protein